MIEPTSLALLVDSGIVAPAGPAASSGLAVNVSAGAPADAAGVLAVPAGAQAAPFGLPDAPSDFRTSVMRGREVSRLVASFGKLCEVGCQGDRFGQPIGLRFKGGKVVRAVGVQPVSDSVWQATAMFGTGELSDINAPKDVVDLVPGAAAKARKGEVSMATVDTAKHPHAAFQRGVDLFAKIFADVQSAADAFAREDGKVHPVLFVEATSGLGDSICALAERAISARKAGAAKNLVHGIFFDTKDVHRHVTLARRNNSVRAHYTDGRLKVEGFDPVPLPDDLRSLREEVKKPIEASMSVLSTAERDGAHYLVVPEPSSLAFKATPIVEQRLAELRKEFPPPPPAKRPRVGACSGAASQFPRLATAQGLLKDFMMVKSGNVNIGGQDFRILRVERKSDAATAQYLQNHLGTRRTIPAKSHVTSSAGGRVLDRRLPEHRALIPDSAVQWPFSLSSAP